MRPEELDAMIELALETLAKGDRVEVARLIREIAHRWPQAPALCICFSITNAAFRLENLIEGNGTRNVSRLAYKLAAISAADILALETLHRRRVLCDDLLFYWQRTDPYFLNIEHNVDSLC